MLRIARDIKSRVPAPLATALGYLVDISILCSFWGLTNAWLNVRYPVLVPFESHFYVSVEVGVLLAAFALLQIAKVRLRWWAFGLLALFAVLVRLFLTADNISERFLYHEFRIPIDLHLVPEFFRLMYDTSQGPEFASYTALLVGLILGSLFFVWFGSWLCYRRLARQSARRVLWVALLGVGIAGAATYAGAPPIYTNAVAKRVGKEVRAYRRLGKEQELIRSEIGDVAQRIGRGDRLDKLQGNNVLLFFVESYGRTVLERPEHEAVIVPRYAEMDKAFAESGYHVASNFLTSPTFGGFSWFAHSTLNTGFKVVTHLHYRLLEEENPTSLADYFRDAGYRPVHVAPGTTRAWPGMDDAWGFMSHYFAWEIGYQGPRFGWAPTTDQYVIDYVHKREVARSVQPLFIEYALVSSHAPFSDIPQYIEDWSKLGDGSTYFNLPRKQYEVSWSNLEHASEAYMAGITYDLKVLEAYLTKFIKDDTLVILIGDHQPNQAVTGPDNLTWSVPMHVISRRADFVEPFIRRGFTPGMWPRQPLPHAGMERFLEEFLSDFSSEPLTVDPGIWAPPS